MQRRPSRLILPLTSAVLTASLLAATAKASDDDDFLATATIAELDEAGYIIHGANDTEAKAVNYQDIMDDRAVALAGLSDAAFWQQAVELQAVIELVNLSNDLSLVEFMPDATGAVVESAIMMDFDDLSEGPDHGALTASMPDGKSFAANWVHVGHDEFGNPRWASSEITADGDVVDKVVVRSGDDTVIFAERIVTRMTDDGIQTEHTTSTLRQDGSTETVYDVYEDGVRTKHVESWTQPGSGPVGVYGTPEKTVKLAPVKLPPADGTGEVYCPLYLPACRAALEDVEDQASSPVKLLTGYVFVNPGDPSDDADSAPLLIDDPEPFVTNPDPNGVWHESKLPGEPIEISLPVIVLPPPPNQ